MLTFKIMTGKIISFKVALSVVVLSFLLISGTSYSQDAPSSFTELFDINNPKEVDLIFNVKSFIKNKDVEDQVEAMIRYKLEDGTEVENKVLIRPRGNNRKARCYLPPIKIEFLDDVDYQVAQFNEMGNVKMVSLCKVAGNYDQYLVKEFLIYRMYETINEYSLQTYFMKVNFIDSEDKKKPFTGYAFIIEDIDHLAKRMKGAEFEREGLLPVHLYRPVMNPMSVFQFMIGNTDWHIPNMHNIKYITLDDKTIPSPIPVPYDFDYAGFVNTNYAVPRESLPIENIRERYYMGTCMTDEEISVVVNRFNESKDEIYDIVEQCNALQKFNITSSINYLNDFYVIINDDKLVKKYLLSNCK